MCDDWHVDGVELDESELLSVHENIVKIYNDLKTHRGDNTDTENSIMKDELSMPPIVNIIDQLTALIKLFTPSSHVKIEMSGEFNESESGSAVSTTCLSSIHDVVAQEHRVEEGIQLKQLEIAEILHLTEKVCV